MRTGKKGEQERRGRDREEQMTRQRERSSRRRRHRRRRRPLLPPPILRSSHRQQEWVLSVPELTLMFRAKRWNQLTVYINIYPFFSAAGCRGTKDLTSKHPGHEITGTSSPTAAAFPPISLSPCDTVAVALHAFPSSSSHSHNISIIMFRDHSFP